MHESKDLSQASPLAQSLGEGRAGASRRDAEQLRTRGSGWLMVPIRSLGTNHRDRITKHLLLLESHDRYLRFGHAASDGHIRRYAESLDFERDEIFGIYNRKLELIAVAHLAYPLQRATESCAEFGVSVLKSARGRGFGARLFDRAAMHARNDGITQMVIHALSENSSMLNIARSAGAVVQREGSDSDVADGANMYENGRFENVASGSPWRVRGAAVSTGFMRCQWACRPGVEACGRPEEDHSTDFYRRRPNVRKFQFPHALSYRPKTCSFGSAATSEAYLRLPTATFDSQMAEIMHEHFAQVDYRMKTRARKLSGALAGLQAAQTAARTAGD